jgi:hypothetical protein
VHSIVTKLGTSAPVQERHEEVTPEDKHQERHAAGYVDECGDRPPQQSPCRKARERKQDGDREGEHDAERRQDQRICKPAERPVRILTDQQQKPVILDDGNDIVDHARALRAGSARIER